MAQTKDSNPHRAAAKTAAAKIKGGPTAEGEPGKLYEGEDRDLVHTVLEELLARFPRAECRENHDGRGMIEIWSGPVVRPEAGPG